MTGFANAHSLFFYALIFLLGVARKCEYGIDAGSSASFLMPQSPRYVLLWLCESSGRGWQKLSFVTSGAELMIKSTNDSSSGKLLVSRNEMSLVLTNNDDVRLGGKFVVLGIY